MFHLKNRRTFTLFTNRLTRLIRSALSTFEQQLYDATLARLSEETQAALEALLQIEIVAPEGSPEQEQTPARS